MDNLGGGPAFPHPWSNVDPNSAATSQNAGTGMTLRDYFAGQAIIGLLSACAIEHTAEAPWGFDRFHVVPYLKELSAAAYNIASAMVEELPRQSL